jgi:hypothetical protein
MYEFENFQFYYSTIEQSRNMPKGDAQSVPKGWVESTLSFINTAFKFSKLDKQTSWLTLA